jgi:acyl-CoA oxidase
MSASTTHHTSASADVDALRRFLDGNYPEVREEVRATLMRLERPAPEELAVLSHERYRELVLGWARQLASEGGTGLGFPTEYGGGGDVGASIAAFETLAMGDLSLLVKCGVQFGLFGGAVLHLGNEAQHEQYLRDIITMDLPGCFAMTETGHGSNVQELETTTTYDPDTGEFVVTTPTRSARKDYIGNAARDGRLAVVFTQLHVDGEDHGVHALLVPIRDEDGNPMPGVTIEDDGPKLGLNGVDNGRLSFDGVRVARGALLNRFADVTEDGRYVSSIDDPNRRFFTTLGTLIQGRISVSGAGVTASKVALTIAVRHALRRRQFGPPGEGREALLMDYPVHQRRLLPRLARTYALHAAQEGLVAGLHEAFTSLEEPGRERRELEAKAAGIKAASTWHATDTVQTCREACGGAGYLSENRFAELKADTDVFSTFEGDNTVLLQLVAKGLLTDYKDQFGELDPWGMARFVTDQVIETVVERTSARQLMERLVDAVPTRDDDAGLLNRTYQLELFRWREEHVLSGVARRLKRGFDRGDDPFEIFTSCQDHVIRAAEVHVERLLLEAFDDLVQRCEDDHLRDVLDRLCSLHALAEVERDRGWFQEHGRLSGERSKSVITAVNGLCNELRPHAGLLVDAFGIPDEILAAPLATAE